MMIAQSDCCARKSSCGGLPFEHPQGQPLGIFELLAFAIDWRRGKQRRDFCVEAKRAFFALVANSLHQLLTQSPNSGNQSSNGK